MIVLISDTHENVNAIERALKQIRPLKPELLIHCGDIVSPKILHYFSEFSCRFVFGNNDFEREGLRKKCEELGMPPIEDETLLSYQGKDIFITHGTRPSQLEASIDSQMYDYVFHGHTHLRRNELIGRTRVVNPGALYRARMYSFATVVPESGEIEFHQVEMGN